MAVSSPTHSTAPIMLNGLRKNFYTHEELLSCGRGKLFGPGNAQLPSPPMLMFDRIVHIDDKGGRSGKGEIIAELDIDPTLWFFQCHFEGDPVMPGCLGLDAMWQLVGFFLGWMGGPGHGRAPRAARAPITRQLTAHRPHQFDSGGLIGHRILV